MDDRALVTAMVHRDPTGLDGAYRRYADRLYAYCVSVLRDTDAAADVVQDTFLLASERAGQLRDPDRLRPWLYAIARHECLRVVRSRRRSAPLDDAGDVAAEPVDATVAVQAASLREMVGAATASLSEPDREVIQLSVRQGLTPAEVGAVLGLSSNHAHARMSRARSQLLRALGALLVARAMSARAGRGDPRWCAEMGELVRGWEGSLTPLLRKRLSRHIDGCPLCTASQNEQLEPATLLPAITALAFAAAPGLGQVGTGAGSASIGAATGSAGAAVAKLAAPVSRLRLDRDGFPVRRSNRRAATVAAAVAVLLLLLGGGVAAIASGRELPLAAPGGPPSATSAVLPGEEGLGVVAPSGTAVSSPDPQTHTQDPPPPPPSQPTPAPTTTGPLYYVVAFTGTATPKAPTCVGGTYSFEVNVQATAILAVAKVAWRPSAVLVPVHRVNMARTGSKATVVVTDVDVPSVKWWIELTATDGRTFTSAANPQTLNKVCV